LATRPASTEVTVGSPDGSVEVVVTAVGEIVDVRVRGSLQHRTGPELAKEMQAAVAAAADAARWARKKLHDEVFSGYSALGGH
jgi:DNA-binding protein YbaB